MSKNRLTIFLVLIFVFFLLISEGIYLGYHRTEESMENGEVLKQAEYAGIHKDESGNEYYDYIYKVNEESHTISLKVVDSFPEDPIYVKYTMEKPDCIQVLTDRGFDGEAFIVGLTIYFIFIFSFIIFLKWKRQL